MLPRSTNERTSREAARGKQTGRTQEIQRLIGRSLRAVTNLKMMPELQIRLDCDVLQADGGTRTASITGGFLALELAVDRTIQAGLLQESPIIDQVAAVSCGLFEDQSILDLDYSEDSSAQADANFVLTGSGGIVEIQATGEERAFSSAEFEQLFGLARKGVSELVEMQKTALAHHRQS
jgi:ribonuclease PH